MNTTPDYEDLVCKLKKDDEAIRRSLIPGDCDLLHMAVGVCGEAGELLDAVKRTVIYRKQLDLENVIEELGDLEFYMEGLRQNLDISRTEVLEYNKRKLQRRYGEVYTDEAAQLRADKL